MWIPKPQPSTRHTCLRFTNFPWNAAVCQPFCGQLGITLSQPLGSHQEDEHQLTITSPSSLQYSHSLGATLLQDKGRIEYIEASS
jgi:hypothetical protein